MLLVLSSNHFNPIPVSQIEKHVFSLFILFFYFRDRKGDRKNKFFYGPQPHIFNLQTKL